MIAMRGLTFALWQRNRIWLLVVGAYFTFFGTAIAQIGWNRWPESLLALGILFAVFSYLALVGVFIHQDADVGSPRSSYPPTMFTLPVKTIYLALCPMILGTVSVFGSSMLLTLAARHGGAAIPLFWPAGFAATLLAVLQVIFWFPLGIPYSKVVLTFVAIPALIAGLAQAMGDDVSDEKIMAGMGVIIALCYATACVGLSRARRGDWREVGSQASQERNTSKVFRMAKPFRSPAEAQRWYEWRLHGLVLPLIAAMLAGLFYVPLHWDTTLSPVTFLGPDSAGLTPSVPSYLYLYLPVYLALIPCVAWIVGCGMRRSDVKRGDRTFHLFFGTRPMSDAALVGAKLKGAAVSTLVTWTVVLLGCLPLRFVTGGHYDLMRGIVYNEHVPLWSLMAPYVDGRTVFCTVGIVAILMVVTWRNYVIGFWTELSGKLWLRYAYPLSLAAIYTVLVVLGSHESPNDASRTHLFTFNNFLVLVSALVAAKLGLATYLTVRQYREGLLKESLMWRSAGVYVVALGVYGGLCWSLTAPLRHNLVVGEAATALGASFALIALLVLWTPLVRILAAPLMLSTNRHRGG